MALITGKNFVRHLKFSSKERSEPETIFVSSTLVKGEHPTLGQLLRTICVLCGVYYVTAHKILKSSLYRIFGKHKQWNELAKRAGTFNKSAQDEVIFIQMAGMHHVFCALLAKLAVTLRERIDISVIGKLLTYRSLYLYALLTEYAFEWTDFTLMVLKRWPYQDREPKFTSLLIFHHLFGLLNFPSSDEEDDFGNKPEVQRMAINLLGMAGIGCLVYPLQQMLNLKTKTGNIQAILLNVFNLACHIYVRFYLFFTLGVNIQNDSEQHLRKIKKEYMIKYHRAGAASLTVFNVLVFYGGMQKMTKYFDNLKKF
mmetsp:Transcript_4/g.10  ORF Transcript_4/g.10 Transcript_4/m.10 type:complete len:312 (-) Transcript_4:1854-2789(-)|eukprot:CAMPEP_0204834588 /NCGR_PEP_ID=MMETSP1346-20131115/20122_1 /ASSEMBLY_ACC=CAM_ASM_000771 /TAXON_ID=215587 /ORGANISM="Aplanochytrium stocchinoi, Strain GSBS06" /LENGTH=311 /DNA_ID=CAMNT_0051967967 /DNA_START=21 /DNA_END=956 /DNA_ORIENTATION=+